MYAIGRGYLLQKNVIIMYLSIIFDIVLEGSTFKLL